MKSIEQPTNVVGSKGLFIKVKPDANNLPKKGNCVDNKIKVPCYDNSNGAGSKGLFIRGYVE